MPDARRKLRLDTSSAHLGAQCEDMDQNGDKAVDLEEFKELSG